MRKKIAVCAITYKRANGLRRLIEGLGRLKFNKVPEPDVTLIIVDNDEGKSGIRICQEVQDKIRWPIISTVEPRRGIPFARNAALTAAVQQNVDLIAFLDDDEVPDEYWLDEMLCAQQAFDADIVSGPVEPYFPETPPRWITKGRFFDRRRYSTGARLDSAATNNVIMRTEVAHRLSSGFDVRFALTGGSDTHFFRRAHRAGFSIVYSNNAMVREWIPPIRANARWILRRSYRIGNALTHCDLLLGATAADILIRIAKGFGRIGLGVITIPLAVDFSRTRIMTRAIKSLQNVWRGTGMLAGLLGLRYEEYRTTHKV